MEAAEADLLALDKDENVVETESRTLDELLNISLLRRLGSGGQSSTKRNAKRRKVDHLAPIVFAKLNTSRGKPQLRTIKVLLDSGSSGTVIHEDFVKKLRVSKDETTKWSTAAGKLTTNRTVKKLRFKLHEFDSSKVIEWKAHVTSLRFRYDMIIGRDLLQELGIVLDFANETVTWDGQNLPMKSVDAQPDAAILANDEDRIEDEVERIKKIVDAKYEKANIPEIVAGCDHLDDEEKAKLQSLLLKYETLFDGSLGRWKGETYKIELKPGAEPYHARAYPVPKAYEQTLRLEVERLVKAGVLKKVNRSEWAAPSFIIPKKDKTVRFITDFRELNKRIKRKPFPIPKIQDLMLKLEGFQYATSLDLNMGYYHIELCPFSKKLCTVVFPWGKYEYQRLPMGLCNSPDIFQEKMSTLMEELEYVRAYIDDLLCLTKADFQDHLDKLEAVFVKLRDAGLKVNAKKSFFAKPELEYLGYWITRQGIQPVQKKVQAIQEIAAPKDKRQLRRFIGMVNYYRDMWIRRSDVLAPLSKLTSKTAKWKWGEEEQKAFDTMKQIIGRETLLVYPKFDRPFDIHTDASHTQLGAVISQEGKPIAFYSRKLNPAQTRYTTTERELLAIVETLKEFKNILLGQEIKVYTDHKNLTFKQFNTERVMRWRLLLEEYGPEFEYIKGENNVVADALSRLDMEASDSNPTKPEDEIMHMADLYGKTREDEDDVLPVQLKRLMEAQQRDKQLLKELRSNPNYSIKAFRGGGKTRKLITKKGKIAVPTSLQRQVVQWYHETLCHPGINRTEMTINQYLYWPKLRDTVMDVCSKCDVCQRTKKSTQQYGHLPEKEAEAIPWERLCVDLIGPYTMRAKNKAKLTLWCLTMIDPATGWFEVAEIPDKEPITIANIVEQTWLTRYPWPQIITYDKGTEFLTEFARMVEKDYGIKKKGATKRNPQANVDWKESIKPWAILYARSKCMISILTRNTRGRVSYQQRCSRYDQLCIR